MRMIKKIIGVSAGLAAIAASGPAAAQYYGYRYVGLNSNMAARQCTAAVQNRLYTRTGLGGVIGSLVGAYATTPRVLSITRVNIRPNGLYRVRGLASSGRYAGYGSYGIGAYGALGYGYGADLSFRCDVAPNGVVYSVRIMRR